MARARNEFVLAVNRFLGVNMRAKESDLIQPTIGQEQPGALEQRVANNVDITDTTGQGKNTVQRRVGYQLAVALVGAHSGVRAVDGERILCGSASGIALVQPKNGTYEILFTPNAPMSPISWTRFTNRVYWTNGEEHGVIIEEQAKTWGVPRAGRVTTTAAVTGNLLAGDYQVLCTFLRDGEEGGTGIGVSCTVEAGGGIIVDLPQATDADIIRVYMTEQNGDVFFRHSDLPMGTAQFLLTKKSPLGKELQTQWTAPPPIGTLLCKHNSRILIAKGNLLYYTMPQLPGLYQPSIDILPPLAGQIRMVQSVEDGIWVDDGRLLFIPFQKAEDPELHNMLDFDYSTIPGTAQSCPPFWFGLQGIKQNVIFFWTRRGFPMVAGPGGMLVPIGEDKMAISDYSDGASLLREQGGFRQILTSFGTNAPKSKFGASDSLEVTVHMRGEIE